LGQANAVFRMLDPDLDFAGMMAQFDTFLIGRKTFEVMTRMANDVKSTPGIQNIVFSRTLKASDYPHVIVSADAEGVVAAPATGQSNDSQAAKAAALRKDGHPRTGVRRLAPPRSALSRGWRSRPA
jgi:hypothetical protein